MALSLPIKNYVSRLKSPIKKSIKWLNGLKKKTQVYAVDKEDLVQF